MRATNDLIGRAVRRRRLPSRQLLTPRPRPQRIEALRKRFPNLYAYAFFGPEISDDATFGRYDDGSPFFLFISGEGGPFATLRRTLLARVHLERLWGEEGPTPEADQALLEPSTPEWGLLLVARLIHRGERGISFAFLCAALGEHTEAARELVDAARRSAEAVDVWLATERSRAATGRPAQGRVMPQRPIESIRASQAGPGNREPEMAPAYANAPGASGGVARQGRERMNDRTIGPMIEGDKPTRGDLDGGRVAAGGGS